MSLTTLSYASGISEQPLLGITIGTALREAARRFPAHNAVVSVFQQQRLSYVALDQASDRVASALLASGVERGDRIAIWSANRTEWLIVHHGAVRIGAIVVTVNPALRQDEAKHVIRDSGAKMVFATRAFRGYSFSQALDAIRDDLPNLVEVVYFDDNRGDAEWSAFLNRSASAADVALAEQAVSCEDPCSLQYTSGTTGQPKGALLTHHNILNNGHFVGERQKLSEADRICLPVPFFHCFGLVLGALAALTHGSSVVLPSESFDAATALDAIENEACTSFYGVPMMYIALLSHPNVAGKNLSSLRTGCMGGAPCPIETMRQAVEVLNMREITVTYGMTETSPISFQSLPGDSNDVRVTTVGVVHPHIEAKIVDPASGRTVDAGKPGELCIRGYSVMRGYWQNPVGTREVVDEHGWMRSGDLATMLPGGYLQIVGRIKNTIIRGGENIYPREIEEFLITLPDIAEAYVFGIPDMKYGEEVCAWVRLRNESSITSEQIRQSCKGRIATFKIPRYVRLVSSFPTTASGKVQYFRMRETELEFGRSPDEPASVAS